MNARVQSLLSARGFHISLGVYLLALYVLRITLFPGASEDDAEQLFYSQSLTGGYKPGQPPLYTWIVYLILQITGVALPVVVAIKFAAIAAIYGLSFQIARLMHLAEGWVAFAGISVLGLYYIGWDSVLNYSQTVLMAAFCLATIHALARIMNGRVSWGSFLYLGVVAGCGVMTKYNFAIFLAALIGAALMDMDLRRKLISAKGLLVLAVIGLIALPHAVWLLGGAVDQAALSKAVSKTSDPGLDASLSGLEEMIRAAISMLSPLLILFVLFFPKAFFPIQNPNEDRQRARKLLERGAILVFVLMGLMIVVSGMTSVRNHWMIVLIAFPVYGTLRISEVYSDIEAKRVRWFVSLLVVLAGIVMSVLIIKAMQGAHGCRKCRLLVPISQLADQIRDTGFQVGTVLSFDYPTQLGGNLRRYFPDSRFVSTRFNHYNAPEHVSEAAAGQCLAIWLLDSRKEVLFTKRARALKNRLNVEIDIQDMDQMQITEVHLDEGNTMQFGYILIDDPARQGNCR